MSRPRHIVGAEERVCLFRMCSSIGQKKAITESETAICASNGERPLTICAKIASKNAAMNGAATSHRRADEPALWTRLVSRLVEPRLSLAGRKGMGGGSGRSRSARSRISSISLSRRDFGRCPSGLSGGSVVAGMVSARVLTRYGQRSAAWRLYTNGTLTGTRRVRCIQRNRGK